MKQAILVCAVLCIAVGPVLARDIVPLPWDPTIPTNTSQTWEFSLTPPAQPTNFHNLYGVPAVTLLVGGVWPWVAEGPDGTQITVLHFGPDGGSISMTIPNSPDPNVEKLIQYQVTSDKSLNGLPTTSPPGTLVPGSLGNAGFPGGSSWYTYSGVISIPGNPPVETITFDFVFDTNVEEIVIKTVCIPEPATMSLLGLGLAGVVMRRRRR